MCLRRNHTSHECHSTLKCSVCGSRHHVSICTREVTRNSTKETNSRTHDQPTMQAQQLTPVNLMTPVTTSLQCLNAKVPVLLQTAQSCTFNPDNPGVSMRVRILFDSGSQRSYVTENLKWLLSLLQLSTETMLIKTFGSDKATKQSCDVECVGLGLRYGDH